MEYAKLSNQITIQNTPATSINLSAYGFHHFPFFTVKEHWK